VNPSCLIQLFLESDRPSWNLWLSCSEDRGDSRFWRNDFVIGDQKIAEFADRLPQLLEESFNLLNRWRVEPEQLESATKLTPLPPDWPLSSN
jgi:hypothetical protein